MDSLLQHMVDMTGHRDHAMLDISVITAVQELSGATQARMLTLTLPDEVLTLTPRAIIHAGSVARLEETGDNAPPGEPVALYPALQACLAAREHSAEMVTEDGAVKLWLPIWIGEKADTCIEIINPTPYNGATIQIIAGIISVYRNFQNLLDYSERDSLTGLLNRKTFEDQLAKMLLPAAESVPNLPGSMSERRQPSEQTRQWLAVIDIDHFKLINDKFGHLYGDEVLILIANLMQSSFRSDDRVFRFGGEEFVVLLRSSTLENARIIIERFRTLIAGHDFPQVGNVTVSIGYVSINAYEAPVVTLGRADQALYFAKGNGRNQACHYDELVSAGNLQVSESNDTAEFF
jgi:diguanylate cyclase (GGDEF)-like protein